ncbi:hypothetical protein A2U01_0055909, partial [Trifolium medium]|nr:hypothetical protein [Trifolium medium]
NKLEVEVPTINEEKTPAQVELQGTPVIEALNTGDISPFISQTTSQGPPQNMAQHDAIIADAPDAERESNLNLEGAHSTNDDQQPPQVSQEDKALSQLQVPIMSGQPGLRIRLLMTALQFQNLFPASIFQQRFFEA